MSTSVQFVMPLLVAVPIVGAVLSFLFARTARWVALATLAVFAPLLAVLIQHLHRHGPLRHEIGGWGAPLGIELAGDGLSSLLLFAVFAVSAVATVYSSCYFIKATPADDGQGANAPRYFWPLWLFLLAGLNALFLSADLFNLYVTLELVGFSAVALVAVGGESSAVRAALRYLLVSLAGSLFFLLGVALIYGAHSTLDLGLLSSLAPSDTPSKVALALMTAGLLMKGALFPLHFWLPPAHGSAPAPVSAALSALVVKGPVYILLRLWLEVFGADTGLLAGQLLGALGAGAILWGSLQALTQDRLKMLIAYSTVAQLGYLFLVFPLAGDAQVVRGAVAGVATVVLAHAFAKAAMFLCAGNFMKVLGHDRLDGISDAVAPARVSFFAFGLAGLSIIGLPPSGGFAGKWLLLTASLESGQWWWAVVLIAGTLLAAAYVLRCLRSAFLVTSGGPVSGYVPNVMQASAFALALLAATMGLFAWPSIDALVGDGWLHGAIVAVEGAW